MLVLFGCNHRSAPVELRERLAFPVDGMGAALRRLVADSRVEEALILSTCNRVEVLVRVDGESCKGLEAIKAFICSDRGVGSADLERHGYHHTGLEVVRHLFEVASGLDSMILGEPQILGQVRQAYQAAKQAGSTGPILERFMQQCLASAKRIRTETGISRNAVSVAFAAVGLARHIFGDMEGRSALLIGAGKMSELVARHLVSNGVGHVWVASRTYNHAVVSASRFGGRPVNWDDGFSRLVDADVVVTCTGAPRPILSKQQVATAMRARKGKPLFIIDIAVPRDVEPDVHQLDNVYLYDIDGLQDVVDTNLEERRQLAARARTAIRHDVEGFDHWRQSLEVTPTIVDLRRKLQEIGEQEIHRFRRRLGPLSAEQERRVHELTRAVIQKILHHPVSHLKRSVDRGDVDASASLYREIFALDQGPGPRPKRSAGDGKEDAQGMSKSGPRRMLRGGKKD